MREAPDRSRRKGEFELVVAEERYRLKEGDSFFFASDLPHRYRNLAPGVTRVLWVSTPLTF